MLPHEDGVLGDQHHLLIGTAVTGHKAVGVVIGTDATRIGALQFRWKKILEAEVPIFGIAGQISALESAQLVRRFFTRAVDEVGVQDARDGVHRTSRAYFNF